MHETVDTEGLVFKVPSKVASLNLVKNHVTVNHDCLRYVLSDTQFKRPQTKCNVSACKKSSFNVVSML